MENAEQRNDHARNKYAEKRRAGMTSYGAMSRTLFGARQQRQYARDRHRSHFVTLKKLNKLCSECRKLFL